MQLVMDCSFKLLLSLCFAFDNIGLNNSNTTLICNIQKSNSIMSFDFPLLAVLF